MSRENNTFSYTYSSKERQEVEAIRRKYLPPEEDRMERLRRLDRSTARKGRMASMMLGTVGCLVMGTGMSMCMVWADTLLVPGIVIGVVGMVGVALAYPLHVYITKKERERVAPEILRLTEELMK